MKYKNQSSITSENELLFRNAIISILKGFSAETLLDLGSGDGSTTQPIAKALNAKKVICVDHETKFMKKAQEFGYKTIASDLNKKIQLKSNSIDFIVTNQVIEHIARTDTFVSEISRILKKGGKAVICTPNLASWHNIGALVLGYQPFSSQVSDEAFIGNPLHPLYNQKIHEYQAHLRLFTKKSLIDICTLHKLKPINFRGIGFYPFKHKIASFLAHIDPIHSAYLLLMVQK